MGERFTWGDLTVESQEDRPHGIGGARIRHDHLGYRLGSWRDLGPDAELFEHARGGGSDRRGAAVLLPYAGGRRVDDRNPQSRARLFQRDGRGQSDITGAGDQYVEPRVLRRFRFAFRRHVLPPFLPAGIGPHPLKP